MNSHHSIPLYPHPPPSPNQTRNVLLSDDFPPCRVHETTPESSPDPPIHSGANHSRRAVQKVQKAATKGGSELPSQSEASSARTLSRSHQSRLKNKGLGKNNVLNTIEVTVQNHIPESSLKRGLDAAHDYPSKRQRQTSVGKNDMDWIKDDLNDIKMYLREITDHLRDDLDIKIDEVIHRLQQMRDMELGY